MGGSSLAPEVIAGTAGVELTVLDSTDPEQVSAALADRLAETAIVVSSKSGSTLETDSQRRIFEHAFTDAGIDAKSRIIIVTDPGSPLDKASREAGYRAVFNADPNVGGRFSALTAFGLVPCGLAGVDIQAFLDEAEEAAEILNEDARGKHRPRPRHGPGRHQPAAQQDRHRRGRLRDRGLRRLGRTAHRRVHRQARHRRAAGRRRSRRPRRSASAPPTSWWSGWSPRMPTSNSAKTKSPSPAAWPPR